MERKSIQTWKSILLLAGAFTFAFLLGETVHEYGHYLGHLVYGNTGVRVQLDPFGASHIEGGSSILTKGIGVTSAAGALMNLVLGLAVFLVLRRRREPGFLPLLLWGPVALVQEGVTFSLGLSTPGGDARWVATLGIPEVIILLGGIILLALGIWLISRLLPLAGIEASTSFGKKYTIVVSGMCSLMLLRSMHSFLASPQSITENLVPLIFSLVLAVLVVFVNQSMTRARFEELSPKPGAIRWPAVLLSVVLGLIVFTVQIIV